MTAAFSIHPQVDSGVKQGAADFSGGTLYCNCASDKVAVSVASQAFHQHVCGCSKCWKPAGAAFSQVAAVPRDKVTVSANANQLEVVDPKAAIKRYACKRCGTHLYGRIDDQGHPLYGFDFIHTELSPDKGWAAPQFAAFVSSIIEGGFDPSQMDAVRARLNALGLTPYDCLSPPLMDFIATHIAKKKGVGAKA